jgi:hypothetical protein
LYGKEREGVKRSNFIISKQEIETIVCKIVQEIEKALGAQEG